MNNRERIGILGGTFDPVHKTHLAMAHAAMRHASLDRVLFVVAADPPHKRGEVVTPAEERLRMVALALEGEPGLAASRIELDRSGPSYTADTLQALRAAHPGAEFFLILGLDAVHDLPRWHKPDAILREAHILAIPRPSEPQTIPDSLQGRCTLIPFEMEACSSTQIRAGLRERGVVESWLPPRVLQYIRDKGLYDAAATQPTR